jgi:hypothetical protein
LLVFRFITLGFLGFSGNFVGWVSFSVIQRFMLLFGWVSFFNSTCNFRLYGDSGKLGDYFQVPFALSFNIEALIGS